MIARAVRVAVAAPLLAVLLTAGGVVVTHGHAPGAAAPCAAATYAHRVALVVEHGNGQSLRECIGFDSATITGEQILQASGIEFATVGYGGSLGDAVCQIDHEPASYPSTCWTTTSPYWVSFVARGGGSWSTANQGASAQTFNDGDAAGFRYDPQTGGAPAPVSPAGTCTFSTRTPPPAAAAAGTAPTSRPSSAPAQTVAPPTSTSAVGAATSGATQSPGVIGVAPVARAAPAKPASLDTGLLLAAAGGGVLAGLLALQILLRRRRTT